MAKKGKLTVVPRLRFPEFQEREEWSVDSLAVVADFVNEKISLSSVSTAEYVSTENLLPDYGGVAVASKLPAVGSVTRYQIGDVLISNIRPYLKKVWHADRDGGVSNDVMVVRAKGVLSSAFLASVLKSDAFIGYVMLGAKGVKMPRGDVDSMRQYPVGHPGEREQQKIVDCLTSLDKVISAQERKVAALKTYKRGLMQQLFPRKGETLPLLRFPEFRDRPDWTLRRIGDLLKEVARSIDMGDAVEYSLVTVRRRYGGVVSRERLKGRAIKVKSQFVVRKGDFLISKRQIVHNACGIVPAELDGAIVSNEYSVLGPKKGCDIEFFNYFSQQPAVSVSFLNSSVGIVIEKMLFKLNTWLKHEFLFPAVEEQRRIAALLASMEKQIRAESDKLDALETHKKGLMQQLFPSLDEA